MDGKLSGRNIFKLLGVAFVSYVLVACGVPHDTLTPTASATATSSRTMTPSPTATSSFTPTPETSLEEKLALYLDSQLSPIDSEIGTQKILVIKTVLELDESLDSAANGFDLRQNTLEKFVANILYDSWKVDHEGGFEQFVEVLKLAEDTGSWREAEIKIKTDNLGSIEIRPTAIDNTYEFAVNEVKISMINSKNIKFKDIKQISEFEGLAFRVDFINNRLQIYVSPSFGGHYSLDTQYKNDFNWAAVLSKISRFIRLRKANLYNETYIDLLLDGGFTMHLR